MAWLVTLLYPPQVGKWVLHRETVDLAEEIRDLRAETNAFFDPEERFA